MQCKRKYILRILTNVIYKTVNYYAVLPYDCSVIEYNIKQIVILDKEKYDTYNGRKEDFIESSINNNNMILNEIIKILEIKETKG